MSKSWKPGPAAGRSCRVMDKKKSFERSNAFVDDELDRRDRSEMLRAAAGDPRLARELANLDRLKSAIADSVDVPDIELPAAPVRRTGRRRVVLALAASVVLMVAAGLAWSIIGPARPNHGVPVAWAIAAHNSWQETDAASRARAMLRPASLRLNAHVPDLSAAKLRIAYIGESTAAGGQPAMVVGYRGTRGCRVTVLIDDLPGGLDDKAIFFRVDKLIAMVWRAGKLRHVILAEGMAEPRFRLIAESVRRTSLERLPLDDSSRMALARSRAQSPPCAA
jgi:anti-sigma factor RsiW